MALTGEEVSMFLACPLLARIATVDPQTMQPHVVPVWYLWDGEEIWISGFRNTRKFKELEQNKKCAIIIDDSEEGTLVKGILFEGEAELITEPRELVEEVSARIYKRYLGDSGMDNAKTRSWITDPNNVVYRMSPVEMYTW